MSNVVPLFKVPNIYWLDKTTGQLSFMFDVPSAPPNRLGPVSVAPEPEVKGWTHADQIHLALQRREG